jgi:hypothetical protein
MRVHIRPRVLRLARLQQNPWHIVVDLSHELEERVIGKVLERKLALSSVTWVRFS